MIIEVKSKDRIPGSFKKVDQVTIGIDFIDGLDSVLNDAKLLAEEHLKAPVDFVGLCRTPVGINVYFRRVCDIFDSRPGSNLFFEPITK